jgi:outer membrane protein assembly factor BamB
VKHPDFLIDDKKSMCQKTLDSLINIGYVRLLPGCHKDNKPLCRLLAKKISASFQRSGRAGRLAGKIIPHRFMQTKHTLCSLLFCLLTLVTHSQNWRWANSLGSPNHATTIASVAPLGHSGALVCGTFAAPTLQLGAYSLNNAGQDDGYLALADENGQYAWATRFGGAGRDYAVAAAEAPDGELAVAGHFNSISLNIGGVSLFNSGESDVFVARFKADKTLAWAQKIGTADIEECTGLVMDADGNTLVSGIVRDKFTNATLHLFIRKLDPAGQLLWERRGQHQGGYLIGTALAVDATQSVYMAGSLYGVAVFEGQPLVNDTSQAAFIVKYDAQGNLTEHRIFPLLNNINALATRDNVLYACGDKLYGCIGWGWPLSNSPAHVMQLDTDLDIVWHKSAGGEEQCQSLDIVKSLSVDSFGNVYATGYFFSDTLHFAGYVLPNLFNVHYYYPQVFVLKYSPTGEEQWAQSMGGIHADEGAGILATGEDKFFLAGNFESEPLLIGTHTLHNTGSLDSMYVHLMPARYVRKPQGFLALYDRTASGTPPTPDVGDLRLFPNPADDYFTLQWEQPTAAPAVLRVFSADGRLMRQRNIPAGTTTHREDVSAWPPGIYYCSIDRLFRLFRLTD